MPSDDPTDAGELPPLDVQKFNEYSIVLYGEHAPLLRSTVHQAVMRVMCLCDQHSISASCVQDLNTAIAVEAHKCTDKSVYMRAVVVSVFQHGNGTETNGS